MQANSTLASTTVTAGGKQRTAHDAHTRIRFNVSEVRQIITTLLYKRK
jgi:hypothetical protein